jgi:spoIIIJ-associated protein
MSEREHVTVEATGETVGEAKWSALRELEQIVPDLDRESVEFQVVSEGERGLLGVGFTPARVVATVARPETSAREEETSEVARAARELVDRVVTAIGADVSVSAVERGDVVTITCSGPDVGLFIGKHGQTIDAVQYLANAIGRAQGRPQEIVVDAAGYRARRSATLETSARKAARRAAASGRRVSLEPMTAVERKIVHEALKDDPEVETASEGAEPNRYVVVLPRHGAS